MVETSSSNDHNTGEDDTNNSSSNNNDSNNDDIKVHCITTGEIGRLIARGPQFLGASQKT